MSSDNNICTIEGCRKKRPYSKTLNPYCAMHLARFRRRGHFGLRDKSSHKLEKLPHTVDLFIQEQASQMQDKDIARALQDQGYAGATIWTVKYRRRKLGIRKYTPWGEKIHKAWIRQQALKRHGKQCELCGYRLFIETHHIVPKYQGGPDEVDNLMIVCSNCHILLTRNYVKLASRNGIPRLRELLYHILRTAYPYLG